MPAQRPQASNMPSMHSMPVIPQQDVGVCVCSCKLSVSHSHSEHMHSQETLMQAYLAFLNGEVTGHGPRCEMVDATAGSCSGRVQAYLQSLHHHCEAPCPCLLRGLVVKQGNSQENQ